jgi:hypothetical protein
VAVVLHQSRQNNKNNTKQKKNTKQQNNYEAIRGITQTEHRINKYNTYYKNTSNNHSTRYTPNKTVIIHSSTYSKIVT